MTVSIKARLSNYESTFTDDCRRQLSVLLSPIDRRRYQFARYESKQRSYCEPEQKIDH